MKLIDLLVRELPKLGGWPESYTTQLDIFIKKEKLVLIVNSKYSCFEDWDGNQVERDQYESALAASQKVEWYGDGLPSVGCECEYQWAGDEWKSGKICYISKQTVLISEVFEGEESESAFGLDDVKFRPIRSDADKKRDAAIEAIDWYMPEFIPDTPNEYYHAKKIYDAIAAGKIPGVKLED